MSTGLIIAAVIAFVLIDAVIFYFVFVKRHKAADDYAEIPLPGETQVQLPAGKVKITYQENHWSSGTEHDINFSAPGELKVEVRGGLTGEPLEIDGTGFMGLGSSKSTGPGFSRDVLGKVEITEPGVYTVTVTAPPQDPKLGAKILVGK